MKNAKLSNHSKHRMNERLGLKHSEMMNAFSIARKRGLSLNSEKTPDKVREYIASKGNCNVKIYNGYVFIYSKWRKQLYTCYKAPDWVIEEILKGEKNDNR